MQALRLQLDHLKTFGDVVPRSDVKVTAVPNASKDITTLLVTKANTSLFEGLIPRPLEPVGAPSFFFSPSTAWYMISTLVLDLMAANEIPDIVRLVNEAFQCLDVYNLDLCKTYEN